MCEVTPTAKHIYIFQMYFTYSSLSDGNIDVHKQFIQKYINGGVGSTRFKNTLFTRMTKWFAILSKPCRTNFSNVWDSCSRVQVPPGWAVFVQCTVWLWFNNPSSVPLSKCNVMCKSFICLLQWAFLAVQTERNQEMCYRIRFLLNYKANAHWGENEAFYF